MRALATRTPDFSPIHRDFDELLGRFLGGSGSRLQGVAPGRWIPPLESSFKDGELVVRVDVPGVDPQAIDVSVHGDRLCVKGERRSSHEEDKSGRTYREVTYGAFERTVTLPWDVDADQVKATSKDGVLEIRLKAPEKAGARKIPVVQ